MSKKKPPPEPRTVGANLRQLREAAGLDPLALAYQSGLSLAYVYRLESGQREPSLSVARRLAKALGCSLDALIEGVEV